ncbi:MAG: UbiX family flavin prenyltransferase [Methanomassiliicoccales archaeon]|nr:MAG: UbiX family flavin prenyltransferase [Methanomassiliicoccales archaeon]
MRVVVAITGASGVDYAVTLLRTLKEEKQLIISAHGERLIEIESAISREEIESFADKTYEDSDLEASVASGSSQFDAMCIVPCSMSTLSKIACGIADTLITRTASVCLKEGRKLILVPRETPLSKIHIDNMSRLAGAGAIILPAMPAFYSGPKEIQDMVNFIVGKIMEALGLEHQLYKRWKG